LKAEKIKLGHILMLRKLKINEQQGFTLIELMIVIAIIGVLAAIAIPNFIAYRDKAYCGRAESDAKNTLAGISAYFSDAANIQMPSIQTLIDENDLTLNTDATNVSTTPTAGSSAAATITVHVFDDSGRCPRGTVYTVSMGGSTGDWN
jgi:type IV pilus assembly protein PilA